MKPENGNPPAPSRIPLLQAAVLGGLTAVIIFVIQRSQEGFSTEGAGPMLLWHLAVGAGAFVLGALVRNRLLR